MKVRLDFMLFCELDLHAPVPDETTHCRFRNALMRAGIFDDLLAEVCRQNAAGRPLAMAPAGFPTPGQPAARLRIHEFLLQSGCHASPNPRGA